MTTMRIRRLLAVSVVAGAVAAACGTGNGTAKGGKTPRATHLLSSSVARAAGDEVSSSDVAALVDADTRFAFDLFREAATRSGDDNLFFSPYSIATALGMVAAGARGETAAQIHAALHAPGGDFDYHAARNAVDLSLHSARTTIEKKKPLELAAANSLWGQDGYDFRRRYLDLLARYYGAGLRIVDYERDADGARVAVNAWVADQTRGRIKDLIAPGVFDEMTRLTLVNAVYFAGNWIDEFDADQTADRPFTTLAGRKVEVATMQGSVQAAYHQGADWASVRLSYAGDASMLLVVPDAGTFADVARRFDAGMLAEIDRSRETRLVDLRLPKFAFSGRIPLTDILKALGVHDAFVPPPTADFGGMSAGGDLYLDQAIHQADVAVDEHGTVAAAATAMVMRTTSAPTPATLHVDRPFLFLVQDDRTHEVLFAGRVTDPTA
jgi:serpin B